MANCRICGKRLPLFYRDTVCRECRAKLKSELEEIKQYVLTNKDITDEQIEKLKNQDKTDLIKLYNDLFEAFSSDKELDISEITALKKLQEGLSLSNSEVQYDEKVKPHPDFC
jgi:predicted amidophosphoribosyltransferase